MNTQRERVPEPPKKADEVLATYIRHGILIWITKRNTALRSA